MFPQTLLKFLGNKKYLLSLAKPSKLAGDNSLLLG